MPESQTVLRRAAASLLKRGGFTDQEATAIAEVIVEKSGSASFHVATVLAALRKDKLILANADSNVFLGAL